MASSQVEVVVASAFGCVHRDHTDRGDRRRDLNTNIKPKSQSNFYLNLKDLVRDHLHPCISMSSQTSNSQPDSHNGSGLSCFGGGNNSETNTTTKQHHHWETQKAKEMASTIENLCSNHKHESPRSSPISLHSEKGRPDPSPTPSESSSSDFSVSSLVQKWRGFEAEARHNQIVSITSTNSNDTMMSKANSDVSTLTVTTIMNDGEVKEDSTIEKKGTNVKEGVVVSTFATQGEKERIRVADIVRKWAGDEQHPPLGACLESLKIGMDSRGDMELRTSSSYVLCSPKIRGRQAIADLFMRMENERYKEVELLRSRHPVSKFTQRGRIQSLLRLKLLRRELTMEEQRRPPLPSRVVGSSRRQNASMINNKREKFINVTYQEDSTNRRNACKYMACCSDHDTRNVTPKHALKVETEVINEQNPVNFISSKHILLHADCQHSPNNQSSRTRITNNQKKEKGFILKQASNVECPKEDMSSESCHAKITNNSLDIKSVSTSKQHSKQTNFQEDSKFSSTKYINEVTETISTTSPDQCQQLISGHYEERNKQCAREEESMPQSPLTQVREVFQEDISSSKVILNEDQETDKLYDIWVEEDEDAYNQHFFETNLDWISEISRPRSYWEDIRQAWYQEVFNTRSQDEEIRQLLERGSVSNVLASDFRERMDQLITNNLQRIINSTINEEGEEDRSTRVFLECHMSSFHHNLERTEDEERLDDGQIMEHVEGVQHEDDEGHDECIDEREDMSSNMHQYHDVHDYYEQISSPSQLHWNHRYIDHEGSHDSDHVAYTSLIEPSPIPSYDRYTQGGSSLKNSTIEMDLIYDLKSQMEQIYLEISELRKSITSCIDMQMNMKRSIKEEVFAAISREDKVESNDSSRRKPKKGSCCICYEKKVDSLLYRCGHMCTCFNCASELHWSSGKCPICRAQIIDVVRAYPDA